MHRTNNNNDDKNIQKHITKVPYGTTNTDQLVWGRNRSYLHNNRERIAFESKNKSKICTRYLNEKPRC